MTSLPFNEKQMNFEDFLKIVAPKIGANGAFGLARDMQLKAIRKILVDKEIAMEAEIHAEEEAQFAEMAANIQKMPPLPNQ